MLSPGGAAALAIPGELVVISKAPQQWPMIVVRASQPLLFVIDRSVECVTKDLLVQLQAMVGREKHSDISAKSAAIGREPTVEQCPTELRR